MAFIAKQTKGRATDESEDILDIKPSALHQRVGLYIGGKEEIDIREKILAMESDLEKNRLVMQNADIQKKQREIHTLNRKLKREQAEAREDYNLRRNEELGKLQRLVRETIVEIAKEDGFDLIVEQAVFVSERINLTERVLERLQSE